MRHLILTVSAATLMATAAFAQTASDSDEKTMEEMRPAINVANAKIEGNKVTGVTVSINRPGYVVIHNEGAGAPPASLGHLRVEPGETGDLSIQAAEALDPSSGLSLMLHYETNDNNTYDFGPAATDVDTPVTIGEAAIVAPLSPSGG